MAHFLNVKCQSTREGSDQGSWAYNVIPWAEAGLRPWSVGSKTKFIFSELAQKTTVL